MTTNKNLILIFFAVMAIGAAFFLGMKKNKLTTTPTADQTANWKTYTMTAKVDNRATFSMSFPPGWYVHKDDNGNEMVISYPVDNPSPQNSLDGQEVSMIVNADQSEGKSLFEQADQQIKQLSSPWNKDYKTVNQNYIILTDETGTALMTMTHYQTLTYTITVSGASGLPPNLEKNRPTIDQILSTFKIIDPAPSVDTSDWTLYTNKTFGYSLKTPAAYQVLPQSEKQKSQLGVDNNIAVGKKYDPSGNVVVIDVNQNNGNLPLKDYMKKNSIMVNAALIPGKFNGYDSIFNRFLTGTDVFIKQSQYVYHITAPMASADKEIGDIVATFKFTDDGKSSNYDTAIKMLQAIPEIQIIGNAIIKNGRNTFFTQGSVNGDMVTVWFYEGGFPDQHTTKIDTFNVNIKSGVITVDDVAMKSGQETITFDEWKKTVKTRFQ